MSTTHDIVENIRQLVPDQLHAGVCVVEQFGPTAGQLVSLSFSRLGTELPEYIRGIFEHNLLHDGEAPASVIDEYRVVPIHGVFGRSIGYSWVHLESDATSKTDLILPITELLLKEFESEKRNQFHEVFRTAITSTTATNAFHSLQRALEGGLFAQRVIVWELNKDTLRSLNAPNLDIPRERGFVSQALSGDIQRLPNIRNYDGELYIPEFFESNLINSALAFPVRNHIENDPSALIGVVGIFYRRPNGNTDLDELLCGHAVDYFSLIWSLQRRIDNKQELLNSADVSTSFIGEAATALVDYHDINTIQMGLSNSIESARILASGRSDIEDHLSNAEDRLDEIRNIIKNNRHTLEMARNYSDQLYFDPETEVRTFDVSDIVKVELNDIQAALNVGRAQVLPKFHLKNNVVRASLGDVKRIIRNLASNALRSVLQRNIGGGKVEILVYNPEPGKLGFRVWDNGPGIEPGKIELIFEPFYTTHGADGGRGLGLYAVQAIANKYGGRVQVKTKWGYFAEFEVWIDCEGE